VPEQQPLLWHLGFMAQHTPPAAPQVQAPPLQTSPFPHVVVSPTHLFVVGSQQPVPVHAVPVVQHA
jgi:hypothetical protein